jgi:glycosyltransferase involved in cell wall biosynthesis
MKILQLISSGGMYGAEAVILNLSRTLQEVSHRSELGIFLNSPHPNTQLFDAATAAGIESHMIVCKGRIDWSVLESIRELVRKVDADVVHAHGYKADVYAYLALKKWQTPLVSTCHTWHDTDLSDRIYGAIDRRVLRSYGGVVAVSEEVKLRLLNAGVAKEKVRYIRNGIDLRPFDRSSPEYRSSREQRNGPERHRADRPMRVGLACRLAHEKGVDLFLQMAERVLAEFPSTRFIIAGDGPDRQMLEALVKKLRIEASVDLVGRCNDMRGLFASLDLLVSSSRSEGLPMVLLEAMATSLPVVATAVGAVPSVVRDGLTGVLVPANDVALLSSAVVRLLRNEALRRQFGEAARLLIAQEFSAERMTAEYLHLYQEVMDRDTKLANLPGDEATANPTRGPAGNC